MAEQLEELPLEVGAAGSWIVEIDDLDDAVVTTYLGTEALSVSAWAGDDQAALFTVTPTWNSPASAGRFTLAISAALSAALAPGTYPLQLTITASGVPRKKTFAALVVRPSPGSAAAPRTYCDLKDLVGECSWIESVPGRRSSGPPNFLHERAQAAVEIESWAQSRAESALWQQARLHGPVACVAPIVPTAGVDAGPGWGESTIPDTDLLAAELTVSDAIDAHGLMTTYGPDRGRLRRMAACHALYLALDQCVGSVPGDDETSLQMMADRYRARAQRLRLAWTAYVDTDGDDVPDVMLRY